MQRKTYFSSLLLNHYSHSFTEVHFSVIILGLTCLHLYKLWCVGLFFWFCFSSSNSWTKIILWPKKGQRASQCMWLHGPLASQCLFLPSTCVHIHHHLKTTVCPAASACASTHLGSLFHLRQHGADVKHFHCLIHHRQFLRLEGSGRDDGTLETVELTLFFPFIQWENDESHSQQEPNRWCRWVFPGALDGRELQAALAGFTCTQCFSKSVAMMQKCPRDLHCYSSFLQHRNYCSIAHSLSHSYAHTSVPGTGVQSGYVSVKHGAACLELPIHRKVEHICGLSIKNYAIKLHKSLAWVESVPWKGDSGVQRGPRT